MNMTQLELALAVGVSEYTVWRWEHARKVPRLVELAVQMLARGVKR
jgi:DNA-binding XRE family transcriptional regulator